MDNKELLEIKELALKYQDPIRGKILALVVSLELSQNELRMRKRYESFLKSVIYGDEKLGEDEDFEWFCNKSKVQ